MWGEAGMVKLCQKMMPKLSDQGKTCMMIGYAHDVGQGYGESTRVTKNCLAAADVFPKP